MATRTAKRLKVDEKVMALDAELDADIPEPPPRQVALFTEDKTWLGNVLRDDLINRCLFFQCMLAGDFVEAEDEALTLNYTLRHDHVPPQSPAWRALAQSLRGEVYEVSLNHIVDVTLVFGFYWSGNVEVELEVLKACNDKLENANMGQFTYTGLYQTINAAGWDDAVKIFNKYDEADAKGYAALGEDLWRAVLVEEPPPHAWELLDLWADRLLHINQPVRPPTYAIGRPEQFLTYLTEHSSGMLAGILGFSWPANLLLSGGSVVDAWFQGVRAPGSDFDFWVTGNADAYMDTLEFLLRTFKTAHPHCYIHVHRSVLSVLFPEANFHVQVIYVDCDAPWIVPSQFDFDYVQAYFDGKAVHVTPRCWRAWKTRTATPQRASIKQSRLDKAQSKGFEVQETKGHINIIDDTTRCHRWYHPVKYDTLEHVSTIMQALFPGSLVFDDVDLVLSHLRKQGLAPFGSRFYEEEVDISAIHAVVADNKAFKPPVEQRVPDGYSTITRFYFKQPIILELTGLVLPLDSHSPVARVSMYLERSNTAHQQMADMVRQIDALADAKTAEHERRSPHFASRIKTKDTHTYWNGLKVTPETVIECIHTGKALDRNMTPGMRRWAHVTVVAKGAFWCRQARGVSYEITRMLVYKQRPDCDRGKVMVAKISPSQ